MVGFSKTVCILSVLSVLPSLFVGPAALCLSEMCNTHVKILDNSLLWCLLHAQVSTPSSMTQLVADEQEALKELVKACCPGLGAPGSLEALAAEAAAAAGLGTVSGWCSSVGKAVTYDLRQW